MRALLIAAVLLAGGAALESTARADEAYDTCVKSDAAKAEQCGRAWIAREDSALQTQWERLLLVAEDSTKAKLVAEQSAWQQFRASACQFYADSADFGPEMQSDVLPGCVARIVTERREQLRDYTRNIDP